MAANLSTLSSILKEYYLGPIQDQFNNDILVTQLLNVDGENLEGLKAVVPLHTGRSGGIFSRAENVTFGAAGNQGYQRATYDLKYHYARIQVSGPAISKTKSDAGSFARALKEELSRIKDDLALDFARQLYGDGTGQVAQCGTTTASTTVVLANAEAVLKGFIYVGMIIDIGDATMTSPVATGRTVTDVDTQAGTIVISGATVTTSATHFVFRAGNVDSTNGVQEMDAGLQKLISTSTNTVGTLNAASAGLKFWDNLRDTSGGAISLDNLQIDWNKAANAGARADEIAATTTPGLVRRLFATADFKTNVRFVDSQTMNGGFEKVTFNAGSGSIQLHADRLHPFGKIHFVHKKHMRLFSPGDWDFLSRDGLTIRWVTDQDAFQAVLFRYANLGTDRRNTSLVMSGLTDTGF
jgi:hypothetical protein